MFPDGRDYFQWEKWWFWGTVFSRSILSIGDTFPNPQHRGPHRDFSLGSIFWPAKNGKDHLREIQIESRVEHEVSGKRKNLTKKYSQQMQYNHCYTKISHKNGIPTNLLFRCINFFSTLGPDCHVFITQAWSSRRQNYRIHRVLESQPKAGPAVASQSQNVNHTLPATLDCFSWGGGYFMLQTAARCVSHLKPSSRILEIPPPTLFSRLIPCIFLAIFTQSPCTWAAPVAS